MSDSRLKDRVYSQLKDRVYSQLSGMVAGSVYGLPAWMWAVIFSVLLVGFFFPVSTPVTKTAPEEGNKIGLFTDGATNESATLRYTARINNKPGFAVEDKFHSPELLWKGNSSKRLRSGVVSYDADRGVFYKSAVYRLGEDEFKKVSTWASSGTVVTRTQWTSGYRRSKVEILRSSDMGGVSNTMRVVDGNRSGDTRTVVVREKKGDNIAQKKWENLGQGWTVVYHRAPYVSRDGEIAPGMGVAGGSVDVSDPSGVAYSAEFDYKYTLPEYLYGATDVYGEDRIPLALKLFKSVERVSGEFVRKEGASGVPESRPDWVAEAMNGSNSSE